MGVLTKYFGFLKATPNENVDVEKHINDTFDSIDNLLHTQSDKIDTKEPKIIKKSGFNLDKSDSITSTSSSKLATSKAVNDAYEASFHYKIINGKTTNPKDWGISGDANKDGLYKIQSYNSLSGEDDFPRVSGTSAWMRYTSVGDYGTMEVWGYSDNAHYTNVLYDNVWNGWIKNVTEKDISDSISSTSSATIASSKAVFTAYDKGVSAYNLANTKEPAFSKKSGFNKNFGTSSSTVLEGSKLAETLGIPYGGILNNSTSKVEGTAYYDNTTKKTYKCTSTTSLNYAESTKFEAISNNDLLNCINNLLSVRTISNPAWSEIGKYTLPVSLSDEYRFIYVYLGDVEYSYSTTRIVRIPYEYKDRTYLDAQGLVTTASQIDERIEFRFNSDSELEITMRTYSGHDQTAIYKIEQRNL